MKHNPDKIQRKIQKHNKKEQLTNMYMIQMSYGILGLILLRYIYAGYTYTSTWGKWLPPVVLTLTAVFAVGAAVLAGLMALGRLRNVSRAKNYVVFLCVLTLLGLWIRFYNSFFYGLIIKVIPVLQGKMNSFTMMFTVPMYGIAAFLVAGFVVYTVRLYRVK